MHGTIGRYAIVGLLGFMLPAVQSDPAPSLEDGEQFAKKLAVILERAKVEPGSSTTTEQPIVLYEFEVNGYLEHQASEQLPEGVSEPRIELGEAGAVATRALVDLEQVSHSQPRGILDPLRYLTGTVQVSAHGVLETARGTGQLSVEGVSIGGVPVPRVVLYELVQYYSRTEQDPDGFDMTEAFLLPYGIDEVDIHPGEAIIMQ